MNRPKPFQTAALGLSLLLPVAVRADDWPQWRGPNHDNVWNETGLRKTFPAEGLKIRWRAPVGPGRSSPVLVRGRVYLTDMRRLAWVPPVYADRCIFARNDEELICASLAAKALK